MFRCVGAPVALKAAQRGRGFANRGDGDFARREPDVLCPGCVDGRVWRQRQVAVPVADCHAAPCEFLGQWLGEALGRQVGGLDQERAPGSSALNASSNQPAMSSTPPVGATGPSRIPPMSCT